MKNPKILVVYTGGTFGMDPSLKIPKLSPKDLKARLLKSIPEMSSIARCDVDILFNIDSCQMNASHWITLAKHLHQKEKDYDGAVILHGTDTLAYSAAAISMLLSPTRIPIVFTGAQKPLSTLRSDARLNFISALEVAAHAPKNLRNRVLTVFHDELFLGSRVRKKSAVGFDAFESPRFPVLARIGSSIHYEEIVDTLPKLKARNPNRVKFLNQKESYPKLSQILSLQITPNFSADLFQQSILAETDGVLLTLYPSGTAPTETTSFTDFLGRAKKLNTPLYAITEREQAPALLSSYEAGQVLVKNEVIWCHDLTPEAAFVKAWLLRAFQTSHTKETHYQWLKKNWAIPISDETTPVTKGKSK